MFAEIDVHETNKNPKCSNLAGAGLWSEAWEWVREITAGRTAGLLVYKPSAWMLNILLLSRAIELPITRRSAELRLRQAITIAGYTKNQWSGCGRYCV